MARNNQIERTSEIARGSVREANDRAEDVVQTGVEAARRVAEEFGRVLGVAGQNENLTRQASQNFEAITETGSVLIRGFQAVGDHLVAVENTPHVHYMVVCTLCSCYPWELCGGRVLSSGEHHLVGGTVDE
jgi:hypothetical protein